MSIHSARHVVSTCADIFMTGGSALWGWETSLLSEHPGWIQCLSDERGVEKMDREGAHVMDAIPDERTEYHEAASYGSTFRKFNVR